MYIHMLLCFIFFFFNDTATTEIYTLSLHDALPIWLVLRGLDSAIVDEADSVLIDEAVTPLIISTPRENEMLREVRSEEHTSELQSQSNLVCRLLLEKKKKKNARNTDHVYNAHRHSI